MRTTTILSLTLSLLSLGSNASNSSDISEIFPNLGTLPPTGDYSVVYINPDTHKLVEDSIPNVSKRGQSYYEDPLVALLRRNNAYGFCKAYCTGEKPSTVTKTKSATKTVAVSKSTTSCLNKCVPKTTVRTVKGASLAPSIVTTTTTVISTELTTLTAVESVTVAASADSTITEEQDATITADPSTATEYTTETSYVTETDTATTTSTLNFGPSATATLAERDVKYPPYLRGYRANQIEAACKVLNKPPPKTITVTHTKTISSTHVRTFTSVPAIVTHLVTSTPPAATLTTAQTDLLTITETATLTATAYITSTSVYLHTETSTSFATTTPVLTETLTIQATETTTTTSTKTVSVCPSATYGISGIAVSPPGQLRSGGSAQDAPACCSYCYNTPGCNGWAFLGANYCFAAFGAPPNTAPDSTTCPNGLGTYELGTGGPSYLAGGAGPCAST